MKRVLIAALLFIILPADFAYSVNNGEKPPNVSTNYAVVMDYESGRVLFQKNSNKVVPMASTTKIMTAIVALENSNPADAVTVSRRAASIRGSVIGLKEGQKITMEELLYGLMLRSGNDCAIAIAEHIAGSVGRFMAMMNSKAFDIGAFNTRFTTPHGLDADGHFTTAYDLALITKYAFKNNEFVKIVSTKKITIDSPFGKRTFNNINKILSIVEGADGVKTGYTGKAGRCLVSSAARNGKRVICVVLNSPRRWEDSRKLLEYGFSNYCDELLITYRDFNKTIALEGGKKNKLTAGIECDIKIPITEAEKENISFKSEFYRDLTAPVFKGQQVGRLIVYSGEKELFSLPYKSLENINN